MKECLKASAGSFFISVALINLAIYALGSALEPDRQFGYEAFLVPWIYGGLALLPTLVMYSKRELTVKQELVRRGIHLMTIELILIFFGFGPERIKQEDFGALVFFCLSVAAVYGGVILIQWLLQMRMAKQMTEELIKFQKKNA